MTEPRGKSSGKRELNVLASFALLFVRGVSLWLLIPLGAIFWVAALPWVLRHSTSFGQFLGWLDLNYCIALERGPLRPVVPKPYPAWIPAKQMSSVTHRIRLVLDLW